MFNVLKLTSKTGEPSDQLQLQLKRLYKEGAKYANSHLNDSTQAQEWSWYTYISILVRRYAHSNPLVRPQKLKSFR